MNRRAGSAAPPVLLCQRASEQHRTAFGERTVMWMETESLRENDIKVPELLGETSGKLYGSCLW